MVEDPCLCCRRNHLEHRELQQDQQLAGSEEPHPTGTVPSEPLPPPPALTSVRRKLSKLCVAPDRRFYSADPVHAARPPDHIPPQPDPGERRGPLQLQRRSRQGPEVPAHVRTKPLPGFISVSGHTEAGLAPRDIASGPFLIWSSWKPFGFLLTCYCFLTFLFEGVSSGTPPSWRSSPGRRR